MSRPSVTVAGFQPLSSRALAKVETIVDLLNDDPLTSAETLDAVGTLFASMLHAIPMTHTQRLSTVDLLAEQLKKAITTLHDGRTGVHQ